MEALPRSDHEADDDQTKDKKKRKKDGAKFSVPAFATIEDKRQADELAKPRHTKALADLLISKREQTEAAVSADKAKESDKESASKDDEQEPETLELDSAAEGSTDEQEAEEDKAWPEYELGPTRLNAGEFVIDLSGDTPIAERVVPLHVEQADEDGVELAGEVPQDEPLRMQPEQQQYARDEMVVEPAPFEGPEMPSAAAGGAEVPPIKPPEGPVLPFELPPEPDRSPYVPRPPESAPEPAQVYRAYMERQAAAQTVGSANEQSVTKAELDDAVHYATKSGQNRGVLTGLLVGGAYEHFKHKRREKKAEKRFKAQSKQLESARQDYRFGLQEQEKQRLESDARLGAAERRADGVEKRLTEQARQAERAAANTEEPLNIPPEHRLQTSAWHTIEVDAKTGKPVEQPTFQYGHEYYRERAQEAMPVLQRNAAAGEVALVAAAGASAQTGATPGSDSTLPPVNLPDASMQGTPSQIAPQAPADNAAPKKPVKKSTTPLWPWIIALVVVAICLIVALG